MTAAAVAAHSGQVTVGQLGRSEIHSPKPPAATVLCRATGMSKILVGTYDSSSLEFLVIYTNYQKGRVKNLSKSGGDHYPHVPISSGVPAIEAMTEQRPPTGGC